MKIVRPVVVLAALGCLAGGVSAQAASKPKPVCNQVQDAAGDATGFVVTGLPLPSDANLDILSADIGTGKKTLTAAIRLAALGKDSTTVSDTYYFNFVVGDTKYFLEAQYDGSASSFTAGDFSATGGQRHTLGAVDGKIDPVKKTVTITAPVSTWGFKSTSALSGFDVLGQRFLGTSTTGGATPTADEATSDKVYKGGNPTCLGTLK